MNTNAALRDLAWDVPPGTGWPINDRQDASIIVGDSSVDIADGVGDPTEVTNPSFLSAFFGSSDPSTTFLAPSAGIGAEIDTPTDSVLINSSSGINPDPSDTSRMFVEFGDQSPLYSQSPALAQKQLVVGPAPSGILTRYFGPSSYYEP